MCIGYRCLAGMAGDFLLQVKAKLGTTYITVFVEITAAQHQRIDKGGGKGAARGHLVLGAAGSNELAYRQPPFGGDVRGSVSYSHLRAHETGRKLF